MVTINNSIEQRVRKAVRILDDQYPVFAVYIFGSQVNGKPLGTSARTPEAQLLRAGNAIRHRRVAGGLAEPWSPMAPPEAGKLGQARGKPDKWSDIDVAVFIEGAEKMGLHRRAQLSAMFQREAGDDLELHFFAKDMLDHPPPASFARFVITNGIHLV